MPGTRMNEEVIDRYGRFLPRGLSISHPLVIVKALGPHVWDVTGREFIDFAGGIGVMNVGHNHPRLVASIQAQLDRVIHTSFQVAMYEPYLRLAERLTELAPIAAPSKALLLSTGVEAVENAVKIARAATRRSAVIAFSGGFHGRTHLGMSLTGKTSPYKKGFPALAPEVHHAPFPYEYRGWSSERSLEALDLVFKTVVDAEEVAAIIIEPILGEGGFVPAPAEFLRALRDLCDEHGIVLIVDEIQTGFGRTGRMFAIEHAGVEPDLVTMAKSLGGGLPISAVVGRASLMDAPDPGGLGGTYIGNPLACAAALAVLDIFESEELLARAERLGHRLRAGFDELAQRYQAIGDVRGLGAMLAIELVADRTTRAPHPALTQQVIEAAREEGLLLLKAGLHGNVVRQAAPLNTPPEVLESALARLTRAFDTATARQPALA